MTSIQRNHSPCSKTQALFFSIFTNCWLSQGANVNSHNCGDNCKKRSTTAYTQQHRREWLVTAMNRECKIVIILRGMFHVVHHLVLFPGRRKSGCTMWVGAGNINFTTEICISFKLPYQSIISQ